MIEAVLHSFRALGEMHHVGETIAITANTLFAISLLHGGEQWVIRRVRLIRIQRIRRRK